MRLFFKALYKVVCQQLYLGYFVLFPMSQKFHLNMLMLRKAVRSMADELTCSRRKVKDEYSQNASEDAGDDNVDDVEERLPLDDEVEGDVFIQLLLDVLSAGFVTNGPLSILCEGCVDFKCVSPTPVSHLLCCCCCCF